MYETPSCSTLGRLGRASPKHVEERRSLGLGILRGLLLCPCILHGSGLHPWPALRPRILFSPELCPRFLHVPNLCLRIVRGPDSSVPLHRLYRCSIIILRNLHRGVLNGLYGLSPRLCIS